MDRFKVDMAEWKEQGEVQKRSLEEWEKARKVKRCKCGNAYSYDPGYDSDPGCCASCGNREGELML
jgi:hypothetical protein